MPHSGWVAFDPTNRLVAGKRHLRTAIGHDYANAPTHEVSRGRAKSHLTAAVRVTPGEGTPALDQELPVPEYWSKLAEKAHTLPKAPHPSPACNKCK